MPRPIEIVLASIAFIFCVAVCGLVLSSITTANFNNANPVKSINHVTPLQGVGEITPIAPNGPGLSIVASQATHSVNFTNTGVRSVKAGKGITVSNATGDDVQINSTITQTAVVAGPGIAVTNSTNDLFNVSNTGVRSVLAGDGILVSSPTGDNVRINNTGVLSIIAGQNVTVSNNGGHVTVNAIVPPPLPDATTAQFGLSLNGTAVQHDITYQTNGLSFTSASSAQVRYRSFQTVPDNQWYVSSNFATIAFSLGLIGGDDGQGNQPGNQNWQIPSSGLYHVHATCFGSFAANNSLDTHQVEHALVLASTNVDPGVSSTLIFGAWERRSVQSIAPNVLTEYKVSMSGAIHACPSPCTRQPGMRLTLHSRHLIFNTTGALSTDVSPTQLQADCFIMISKMV